MDIKIYFTDFFEVNETDLTEYGALNVSLINDLPLFVDPFLLFNNPKTEYQELHEQIIEYIKFLQNYSISQSTTKGGLKALFQFPEIKQNWLGFSKTGNKGNGLGPKFATTLNTNLKYINSFGEENITAKSHIEKLCLLGQGVGSDHISDFTTNLIHGYFLKYTCEFCKQHIDKKYLRKFNVKRAFFNFKTKTWASKEFLLPCYNDEYVLLTPINLLAKDETYINNSDMIDKFSYIPATIDNDALRFQVNNYFQSLLPKKPKKKDRVSAITKTINKYPKLIDYYIKYKENNKESATAINESDVEYIQKILISNVQELVPLLDDNNFYDLNCLSHEDTKKRILFLKQIVENNDGYRFFYDKKKSPIKREEDIQLLFKLTWYGTCFDVNSEVNNGRGPVDFKISNGSEDKTLVEFKLAKNSKLKQNLEKQLEIYEKAHQTTNSFKVIIFFTAQEENKVIKILNELKMSRDSNIILIDARSDNKISASNVK